MARLKAIEKDLERENLSRTPAEGRNARFLTESYVVRSAGLTRDGSQGETRAWTREEAMEIGRKASLIPPENAASVRRVDHRDLSERLERVYAAGRNAFAERDTGRSR